MKGGTSVRIGTRTAVCIALTMVGWRATHGQNANPVPPSRPDMEVDVERPRDSFSEVTESAEDALPPDQLARHVPDPSLFRSEALAEIERARSSGDEATATSIERVLERIESTRRDRQVTLHLDDVLRRVLEQSYAIEVQRFNPAIETTRVVEAEAAFDAVFFTTITNGNIDQPSASQLSATQIQRFESSYGIRKLLAPGTQISASWDLNRQKIPIQFQLINPEYTSVLTLEARQPMLRGGGIDFNKAQIHIAHNNRAISEWTFRRQVRDTLRQVEELYWRLVQARREVLITARLLAEFDAIYRYLEARKEFDVIPVQLAATEANLEQSKADFIRRRAAVRDAEDRLLAAMNDPDLPLGGGIELIPIDFPTIERIVVEAVGEVQTALDNRPELKEQELAIANAKIGVGRAKNLELPRLDVSFRATNDGLGGNADLAFDKMTASDFISYFVTVEFEIPFGNRGPRAARRRAELQHAQAVVALKARFEEIILDVHEAVRELSTSFEQIWPSFNAVEARVREVESIVARAERKDFLTLNSELGARRSLAAERSALLNALVNYNIAIIDLERAKGTLLRYNNVVVDSDPE